MTNDADKKPLHKRLAWMAIIWVAGVSALGMFALGLRLWLGA